MNDNNKYTSGNVSPYKATANLNTAIGNPNVNINDPMNVNIQNMATNTVVPDSQNNNNVLLNNTEYQDNNSSYISDNSSINNNNINQNQDNKFVKKTYVAPNNMTKKKSIKLSLGPEFKIALLIVVILLVFVFLLPIISNMFRPY